jgi:hypothetical protein
LEVREMTTKQIAKIARVSVLAVRTGIAVLTGGNYSLSVVDSIREKAGSEKPHKPADYTLKEAVVILKVTAAVMCKVFTQACAEYEDVRLA